MTGLRYTYTPSPALPAHPEMGDPEPTRAAGSGNLPGVTTVQLATTDNAFFKPVELPLPLTHAGLLDAARKKFKAASKQSRLFDATSGAEIVGTDAVVQLATGANVMVSGKAGWKGAERLRAEWAATERAAAAAAEARTAADAAAVVPVAAGDTAARAHLERASAEHEATRTPGTPGGVTGGGAATPLQLQLMSFSYDAGQPHDTAANINARGLPNPGKAARGCTGLDRRLAREVLASPGAAELCERVVQEALRQVQLRLAAAGATDAGATDARGPRLLRVGVGCDRGLHRSVALVEAATARLVRKAEHARSGRNSPGLEVLLRRVQLVDADHRELARRGGTAGTGAAEEEGSIGELRLVVGA